MDYAASFFEGRSSNWSYGTMKNFSTISGPVRYHLQRVYTTLACALFVSAVGVYMHMLLHIGGLITSLAFIATTMWLLSTPATPVNEVSLADGSLHLVSLWFVHSITQSQL
jgi:hypothetical protein